MKHILCFFSSHLSHRLGGTAVLNSLSNDVVIYSFFPSEKEKYKVFRSIHMSCLNYVLVRFSDYVLLNSCLV